MYITVYFILQRAMNYITSVYIDVIKHIMQCLIGDRRDVKCYLVYVLYHNLNITNLVLLDKLAPILTECMICIYNAHHTEINFSWTKYYIQVHIYIQMYVILLIHSNGICYALALLIAHSRRLYIYIYTQMHKSKYMYMYHIS